MTLQIPPNCDLTLGLTCVEKSIPGLTVWETVVDDRFLNPAGVVQGGFLASLADSAMGAAAVTGAERPVSIVNTEMTVSFLRAATKGDRLTCVASVLKSGSRVSFLEAKIYDDRDRLVATASSTYLVSERPE